MTRQGWQYVLLFLAFLSLSLAASPTSFCKCTCFTNSTIIPLDAPSDSSSSNPSSRNNPTTSNTNKPNKHHTRTCADCTKSFCLDYNLPICDKATEDDVFTTCFQRDSTKDELVVFVFIVATVGLLVWALIKPYALKWREGRGGVQRERGQYAAVSGEGGR